MAAVKKNGKWGFVNRSGEEVIACKYGYADGFVNGRAVVVKNGKWGYINKSGEQVVDCKYDYAQNFSGNLAMVRKNDKWGYVNKNGKEVIKCQYKDNELRKLNPDDTVCVCENGKWGGGR